MDHFQHTGEAVRTAPDAQKHAPRMGLRVPSAYTRLGRLACLSCGASRSLSNVHRLSEDFRAEVLLQCQVIEACEGFLPQSVLESFERFLDRPALVIERAERCSRITPAIEQRGHQHTHATARSDFADQAHGRRRTRQFIVAGIQLAGAYSVTTRSAIPLRAKALTRFQLRASTRMQNGISRCASASNVALPI